MTQGIRAWCVPACDLHEGGPINASNHPKSAVLSITPILGSDESAVVIRLAEGRQISAKVINAGNGKYYSFHPA